MWLIIVNESNIAVHKDMLVSNNRLKQASSNIDLKVKSFFFTQILFLDYCMV